jgi:hypothetical protein
MYFIRRQPLSWDDGQTENYNYSFTAKPYVRQNQTSIHVSWFILTVRLFRVGNGNSFRSEQGLQADQRDRRIL